MARRFALILLLALAGASVAPAWEPGPVGPQFQVNSYTTSYQYTPDVAYAANGDFVIVWSSYGSTGSDTDYSVQARLGNADGSPATDEFQVNASTGGEQKLPKVTYQPNGNFIVAWVSDDSGGSDVDSSVQVQRFLADGTPDGAELQANSFTPGFQGRPDVATWADSSFIIVWESFGSAGTDSSFDSIQMRQFAADGTPLAPEIQVNTYTTDSQVDPRVSIAPDGSFVVVWKSSGSAGTDMDGSIHGQRLAADGSPAGSEFQINTYTTDLQDDPGVAHTPGGGFVVTWTSRGATGDTDLSSVQARRYDDAGDPLGDQFQVNGNTIGNQLGSAIEVAADGSFLVAWKGSDADSGGIKAQRFAPDGVPRGSEFQVNTYTTNVQYQAAVAMRPDGDFVVAWASYGSSTDDSSYSVQAQRFSPSFFADGFESGDTSAWSTAVP